LKTQKKLTKAKVQLVTQNEQSLGERQNKIDEITRNTNDIKRDLDKKEEEIRNNKLENENLRLKLEESGKLLENNKQLIEYLNSKINEKYGGIKDLSLKYNTNLGTTNTTKPISSFPDTSSAFGDNNINNNYMMNTNPFNEVKNPLLNTNYQMNSVYSSSNTKKDDDLFVKPMTNFTKKNDTLTSNVNTNFFDNNKFSSYGMNQNPESFGTTNLTNLKYGNSQGDYKTTSLTNQKYGNSIKLTQYLNNDGYTKEKESKFDDEEEQPRQFIGSGIKNAKK